MMCLQITVAVYQTAYKYDIMFICSLTTSIRTKPLKGMIKTHIDDPLKWRPSETLTKSAKKATLSYNMQHK